MARDNPGWLDFVYLIQPWAIHKKPGRKFRPGFYEKGSAQYLLDL